MDDLISRKAAIEELENGLWGKEWDKELAKAMIESLPSVQPEKAQLSREDTTSDCISRQAAIDAFFTATSDGDKAEWCEYVIKTLPSVQTITPCYLYSPCEYQNEDIELIPFVQPEIVLCKECKYYRSGDGMFEQDDFCTYRMIQVFDDDYCSRAERRV